ncbi:hypothetical protein B7494_g7113 [Chlorociboria aeruginascens]|nr:hypothetical protein B7494_g7113 [Chlorociboria aeruginascens]
MWRMVISTPGAASCCGMVLLVGNIDGCVVSTSFSSLNAQDFEETDLPGVTLGMALVPISRHSALSSFFKLSVATGLAFHMLTAYTLFALYPEKGVPSTQPYLPLQRNMARKSIKSWGLESFFNLDRHYNWAPYAPHRNYDSPLNPKPSFQSILFHSSPRNSRRDNYLLTRKYNVLLHIARSNDVAPRLANAIIRTPGPSTWYYHLTIPLPRRRLDGCACTSPLAHFYIYHSDSSIRELHPFTTTTHLASQNANTSPSEHDIVIQFLFRKSGKAASLPAVPAAMDEGLVPSFLGAVRKLKKKKGTLEWTEKLASLIDEEQNNNKTKGAFGGNIGNSLAKKPLPISLRLEGPYFTTADPSRYHIVICFVAGTGISGALAITGAFKELDSQYSSASYTEPDSRLKCSTNRMAETAKGPGKEFVVKRERIWKRCVVVWSIREDDFVELPEFQRLFLLSSPIYQPPTHAQQTKTNQRPAPLISKS